MGCCGGGIPDPEIEECKSIDEIINLIEQRMQGFVKEKENIDIYLQDPTSQPKGNISIYATKEELEEIRNTSSKIEEEFTRAIQLLNKYKNKIPLDKGINNMKDLSASANERDFISMKYLMDEFTKYCNSHYK
jgi:hypothetical protein